tara:strand:+ start:63 stop:731 length:669 start_codon:yes stop_codon:yes gene_type:complete
MPRKLINDYTFYKIVNINGDIELCYVGSTVNMKERKNKHRSSCSNERSKKHHLKVYQTIREHGGWEEFKMVPIGTSTQLSLTQAHIIEEEYRIKLKAELNSQKCFTTTQERKEKMAEYNENNKEKKKEYRENNREILAEKNKEYYEKNKDKVAEYHKEYNEKNKEKVATRTKEYREKNKEQLSEKSKEKITCECGCIVTRHVLARHKKSQKHIKLINNISNI